MGIMDMVNDFSLAIVHSSSQFIVAALVGSVIDRLVMPQPKPLPPGRPDIFLAFTAEMAFQVSANAVLAMGIMKILAGLSPAFADTTSGYGFFLGLFTSQPNLHTRVGYLVDSIAIGSDAAIGAVSKGLDASRPVQRTVLRTGRPRQGAVGAQGTYDEQ